MPTKADSFSFVVRATDSAGSFCDQICTLQVFERVIAPAGLVGWWKAEGDAQDSVGTNHGVLRNGATFAAGKVGQAFSLDGIDDCIEIPDAPALRPVSVTLEGWVTFDATDRIRTVFAKPVGPKNFDSYGLGIESGMLIGLVGNSSENGPILSTPFSLTPGRLYHVAYTFDDDADNQALYVDGILAVTGRVTIAIDYDGQSLLLGRDTENSQPNYFHKGRIDEASIYNRALSAEEIWSIYNAGPEGKRLV